MKSTKTISYATDKTHWLNWQHEYCWGAFYLFPPPEILKQVDALREKYDPVSAKNCQAHVSLSDTLQGAITDEQLKELHDSLARFEPFVLEYGPLRTYPPYPGVCFDIRPADKFFALRETLHLTSLFSGHPLKRRNIPPHMTVAEFGLDMEQSESLCDRLKNDTLSSRWLCEGVSLAVPNNDFRFEEVIYIPFHIV